MSNKSIAVLVGSLRSGSFNRKLAHALIAAAPSALQAQIVEIGELPMYNQDLDDQGKAPAAWTAFRQTMARMQGVIFVTPEYNRCMPAALKNAIDVGSRPWGQSIWSGKAAAVASSSVGAIGGFGANHNVRQAMVFLDVPCMQMPEMYLGAVDKKFDPQGNLIDEHTKESVKKFMDAYAGWIDKLARR